MNPEPTKAEVEFEGDCFGRHHDGLVQDCRVCAVSVQCSVTALSRGPEPVQSPPAPTRPTDSKSDPCGLFRTGSASWAAWEVMKSFGRPFEDDEALSKFIVTCKNLGIDHGSAERNLRSAMERVKRQGLLRKEDGKFVVV